MTTTTNKKAGAPAHVFILGAGPAGLGAGYELTRHHVPCTVLEKNGIVGGLARTQSFQGFRFDVGPHRFFTKNATVNQVWHDVLGADLLEVPRLTRIYCRKRFFHYPLKAFNALVGLGPVRSLKAFCSYVFARLFYRRRQARSFEEWITIHFGRQLYETFFKSYTEKVWGIPCTQIGAEWAMQRIRGLNLWKVIKTALLGNRGNIRTLTERFLYPRRGAGMLYEKMADLISAGGGRIALDETVEQIERDGMRLTAIRCSNNRTHVVEAGHHVLSSMPITEFVQKLTPAAPPEVLAAAAQLRYRDHITVNLLHAGDNPFPDNWIYVHAPEMRMARITNYANFSQEMAPSRKDHGLAVEYFCFRTDPIWSMADNDLIQLAMGELDQIGLVPKGSMTGGFVVREKDAYPVYYAGYHPSFDVIRNYLRQLTNVDMIGRGGMYKYNNQDHALLSGLMAARNLLGETNDLWSLNEDDEYLEEN